MEWGWNRSGMESSAWLRQTLLNGSSQAFFEHFPSQLDHLVSFNGFSGINHKNNTNKRKEKEKEKKRKLRTVFFCPLA
jgi:hypothetical protein